MPEPATSQDFPLDALLAADRSWKDAPRYAIIGFLAGIGSLTCVLGWKCFELVSNRGWSNSLVQLNIFVLLAALVALGMAGIVLPSSLRGARLLRVDSNGVRLFYGRTSWEDLSWKARPGFSILDWSAYPDLVRDGSAYALYSPHYWGRRSLITGEALRAILAAAPANGATVTERIGNPLFYARTPKIYTVRPAP
jgi:hypothetical protein